MASTQQYECVWCGSRRVLPESPVTGPMTVRAGCEHCNGITTWDAVGRARWAARKRRWSRFRG